MQGSANLNVMIKAARKAGRSLIKDFQEVENLQVSAKSAGDFVSRADIAAEKIIKEELTEARPTYGWLGEESDPVAGQDPTRRWIVDPLDGTTNFLHGLPHWAVSIALEHKGQIIAGVVFDACKDELFITEKGKGAWMNDRRIRVSDRHRMTESTHKYYATREQMFIDQARLNTPHLTRKMIINAVAHTYWFGGYKITTEHSKT